MKYPSILLLGFLVCVMCMSCVSYKAQYGSGYEKPARTQEIENPDYTFYFIGDGGNAPMGQTTHIFKYLKKALQSESAASTIVWLGDNIYPVGLAPEGHPDRALGEHRLHKQLETLDTYEGRIFFTPGNHDWFEYGPDGIERQEALIETYLSNRSTHDANRQQNYFLPDNGCGDPQLIALNEWMRLLIFDSHWLLAESDGARDFSHCATPTREAFFDKLSQLIASAKGKVVVTAMHHPIHTFGSHGGEFKFKDYVFPLTQLHDALVVPLPVGGYIVNKMRNYISVQDTRNPLYKRMIHELMTNLKDNGPSVFAGGHEHNLQYIERDGHYFIVSGAGSKWNPCTLGDGSAFCMGARGFVKLQFEDAKSAVMQMIVPHEDGISADVVFEKRLKF